MHKTTAAACVAKSQTRTWTEQFIHEVGLLQKKLEHQDRERLALIDSALRETPHGNNI